MSFTERRLTVLFTVGALALWVTGCDQTSQQAAKNSKENPSSQTASPVGAGGGEGGNPQRPIAGSDSQGKQPEDSSPGDVRNPSENRPDAGGVGNVLPAAESTAGPTATDPPTDKANPNGRVIDQTELLNRAFMTLQAPRGSSPAELTAFLPKVDEAIRDLIVAGSNNIVDNETFTKLGLRLGQMKLDAGEKLAAAQDATEANRKTGVLTQLVALSHLSGLKDVDAAKKLEKLSASLLQSSDRDLQHQGRIVQLGFRLQDLQNGQLSDPSSLVKELRNLFQRPEDAGFTEMMVLQQAGQVLTNMGQSEAVELVKQIIIESYMDATDIQLSMAAWGMAAEKSRAFENYNAALQDVLNDKTAEPQTLIAAARGLFQELPHGTTLINLANAATEIEYRGKVEIAGELHEYLKTQAGQLKPGMYSDGLAAALDTQNRRLSIRGRELALPDLVAIDGAPFDWNQYRGKVVLVDFWATWCVPCLREIPNIRKVFEQHSGGGFEVVSVNMDSDLGPVRQYLAKNPLPWRTLHASDPSMLGFKSTVAKELGITAIPFLVLVDKSGKVSAIHVRGEKLAPSIQQLLATGQTN